MNTLGPTLRKESWIEKSPWIVLLSGVVLALFLAILAITFFMSPPIGELATLIGTLAITSVISLALGYFLYRRGWARSSSIGVTLLFTYAWAAILALINVWVLARLMFVSPHDLSLAGILLVFAAIIATTFGVFVAASVSESLRNLANAANRLARGELDTRVEVKGRDEISQVASSFNEMATELQDMENKREALDNLRRDLIAWTSHDLRTPLTSIRVMIEALNDGLVVEDVMKQRYYKTIRAEVVALNELIDDLFELAQFDAGGLVLEMESHSLKDLISDTLESFQLMAKKRDIDLQGHVSDDLDPVRMNAPKIGRVLTNLVSNAISYTPPGGYVKLNATRVKSGIDITVEDSGPGFSEEELNHVFEKFYRGEQARSRSTGGAGLGLAIASGIVEAHGGRIWAENRVDGGALVGFSLPDSEQIEEGAFLGYKEK